MKLRQGRSGRKNSEKQGRRHDMSENQITTQTMLRKRDRNLKITTYVVLAILILIILYPLVMMVIASEGDTWTKIIANPAKRIPKYFQNHAYLVGPFMRSMIVSVTSVTLNIYFSSLTAYAIVAYEWKLKTVLNNVIVGFMMLPTTISVIGYYQLVWKFHMTNNIVMLILPAIATPLTVFFMKLYLQATFSMEIVESGRIAGASEFRIFNQLVLPLLKPAIATQVIFLFVSSWYDVYVPSIILIDGDCATLPLTYSDTTLLRIGIPLIVYCICSRFIVEGVALGSIKK